LKALVGETVDVKIVAACRTFSVGSSNIERVSSSPLR
jgi:hypothetical protein